MDESRFWPPIAILSFLVIGIFFLSYFDKVDKAGVSLETAKLQLQQNQAILASRQQIIANRQAASEKNQLYLRQLQAAETKLEAAEKKLDEADKKERLVEGNLRYLTSTMKALVEKTRDELFRTEISELKLKSGRLFKQVRLRKPESGMVSFIHSEGIGSTTVEDLPADLTGKLDVGPTAILAQLEQLQAELGQIAKSGGSETSQNVRLGQVRKRIAVLESEMSSASARKDKSEEEVKDYDLKIMRQEGQGIPTFNLRTMRDIAEGNAGTIRNQLRQLELELQKMRLEEQTLLKSSP